MVKFHLPDGGEFEGAAELRGRIRWTAEGRKALEEKTDILKGMFAEERVAHRLGVSVRVVRERARAKGLGRKLGRARHFTEAEIIALMDEGNSTCSKSSGGQNRLIGTSGARSVRYHIGDQACASSPSAALAERPAPFLKPKKREPDQWAPVIARASGW
jgi:hypothetical protein